MVKLWKALLVGLLVRLSLGFLLLVMGGCALDVAGVVRELAQDKATVCLRVVDERRTISLSRTNAKEVKVKCDKDGLVVGGMDGGEGGSPSGAP